MKTSYLIISREKFKNKSSKIKRNKKIRISIQNQVPEIEDSIVSVENIANSSKN